MEQRFLYKRISRVVSAYLVSPESFLYITSLTYISVLFPQSNFPTVCRTPFR
jgi:hypothetical protein